MSTIEERRVVITGLGVVSSVGTGVDKFWNALISGQSGISKVTQFPADDLRCQIAGEIKDFDIADFISTKEARRLDVFCHYAIGAADEALAQAGLNADTCDPTRVGVLVGSGIGGIATLENQAAVLKERGPAKSSPLMVPMMIPDMASGILSIRHNFQGPNTCVVTACASAAHSIGEAMWVIKRGDADAMLTGGAEACLCRLGVNGFCAMRALSERNDDPEHASRPFDAERDGFIPSEGAGILVLESYEHAKARGAEILAEICGYGASADAYHITAPNPDGNGAARALKMALNNAHITPKQLSYVNAHGTSTPLNDKMETAAIKGALGDAAYTTPVSSTKSMTGHTLGAAGGLESAVCVMALKNNMIPPTMNYQTPDPDCDLDYVPNQTRELELQTAMNVNLGFGGHNAALVFRKV